ncbi:GNAT family N-acetyltransferase [Geomicrobium sediminis]|uniref:Ribosomal-protein-serine acetyltransferase n=1 Tax=Geomicrobium sediminis TaxID=1347788 RepID=A0ABS2PH59_9BACL|nr:GNAT family protein [Geomicrobium sediminis]MBM7634773.1 ribosomal-protein-serine acetyltransferase [Geomicrobium sediminis]
MFSIKVNEHIQIHLIEMNHIEAMYEAVHNSRAHLRRWLPWVDQVKSIYDYQPIIGSWLQQFAEGRGFQAGIRYDGEFVGMIGLHDIDWASRKTTMGYWLSQQAVGKGIMTKAVDACLHVLFEEYQLNRVQINCGVENFESQGIPKRLGFELEGVVKDGEWLYDHYHDLYQFSLLRSTWLERQQG